MRKTKHKRSKHEPCINYFNIGPYPNIYFGFTYNPSAFKKELDRLNIKEEIKFAPRGATTHCLKKSNGITVLIVTIDLTKSKTLDGILGLLVHESVHVWRNILDCINEEEKPSSEIEAYHIQNISQCMFDEVFRKYKIKI